MLESLIKTLIETLPRYAEEEGDFYSVDRNKLINFISERHAVEAAIVENTVMLCECLLTTLSVLQAEYLLKGES